MQRSFWPPGQLDEEGARRILFLYVPLANVPSRRSPLSIDRESDTAVFYDFEQRNRGIALLIATIEAWNDIEVEEKEQRNFITQWSLYLFKFRKRFI